METVCLVTPGAKESVPERAVKSEGEVAVAFSVAKRTVACCALAADISTEKVAVALGPSVTASATNYVTHVGREACSLFYLPKTVS
jgi:hypothetical protein